MSFGADTMRPDIGRVMAAHDGHADHGYAVLA